MLNSFTGFPTVLPDLVLCKLSWTIKVFQCVNGKIVIYSRKPFSLPSGRA